MTDWTEDAEQQGWDDELELYLATRKVPSDEDVSELGSVATPRGGE